MERSLQIRTETSFSLNFLVYIQNIFFNQDHMVEHYRFPYFPTKHAMFRDEFELRYQELWDEVSQRIATHPGNDIKIFKDEKDLFYQALFNSNSFEKYNEVHQAFNVW